MNSLIDPKFATFIAAERALEHHRTAVLRRACLRTECALIPFEMTDCERLLMNELVQNRNTAYEAYQGLTQPEMVRHT